MGVPTGDGDEHSTCCRRPWRSAPKLIHVELAALEYKTPRALGPASGLRGKTGKSKSRLGRFARSALAPPDSLFTTHSCCTTSGTRLARLLPDFSYCFI